MGGSILVVEDEAAIRDLLAANLQRAGLSHYRRGHITVVDRKGLEQRTCECYAVVKKEMDRLLPDRTVR